MVVSRAAWGIVAGLALATVAVTVAIWALTGTDEPAREATSSGAAASSRGALLEELEQARQQNRQLEAQVAWLQAQVDVLSGRGGPGEAGDVDAGPGAAAAGAPAADAADSANAGETVPGLELADPNHLAAGPGDPELGPGDHWFDEKGLLAAGLDPREIERLKALFTESEMEVIELEHQARREGWHGKPRYWRQMRNMRNELRAQIGDQDYDYVLYAAGRPNRVRIDGVLEGSPGYRAGLRPGDLVVSYEGTRVFKAGELKAATVSGKLGQSVVVEVLRDGEIVSLYMPRGPMGAKLGNEQVLPTLP